MRPFLIIRVPITLDEDRNPLRRPNYGAAPAVVAELATAKEAADTVARFSYGDRRHHYYGLELRFTGGPDRKSAAVVSTKPVKGTRPRVAVDNSKLKEKKA